MTGRDTFSSFHPLVNFVYFGMVFAFSMSIMHPLCLAVSLFSAAAYGIYLRGHKEVRFAVYYMIPTLLIAAVVNPAFNHEGATMLAYLPSGNPLTLESIIYGLSAAAMLVTVILWFTCFSEVFTSDKFVYLFGKIIPALSLILSMTLRFVPVFTARTKTVAESQRGIGRDVSSGSVFARIWKASAILSVMISWSLENAIETADSMKSRGYGLPGRTAFSIYMFDERDRLVLIWLLFCGLFILSGIISGGMYFRYYPTIKYAEITTFTFCFFLVYLLLCLTPVIINIKEDRTWKSLQSEI